MAPEIRLMSNIEITPRERIRGKNQRKIYLQLTFHGKSEKIKKAARGATWGPHGQGPRPRAWSWAPPVWTPRVPLASSLCLYIVPKMSNTDKSYFPNFDTISPPSWKLIWSVVPTPCRSRESSPEASTRPLPPSWWCVSSSYLGYGFIALARWLSLLRVLQYKGPASYLTWSRSIWCNCY